MIRLTLLIGGIFLLLMVGVLRPLRGEASEAYLVAALSVENHHEYEIVISTLDGQRVNRLSMNGVPRYYDQLVWSLDGRNLYYYHIDPESIQPSPLTHIRLSDGQIEELTEPKLFSRMDVSPDGRWMTVWEWLEKAIYRLDLGSGEVQRVVDDSDGTIYWSPNSEWLYYQPSDINSRVTRYINLDGSRDETDGLSYNTMVGSPTQDELIFVAMQTMRRRLFRKNMVTGSLIRLDVAAPEQIVDWLENDWVIFVNNALSAEQRGIGRVQADGSDYAILLDIGGTYEYVGSSGGGKWIYVIAGQDIYRIDPTTSSAEHLVSAEQLDAGQVVSNERKIIFSGRYLGQSGLFRMNVDGTGVELLAGFGLTYASWAFLPLPERNWVLISMWSASDFVGYRWLLVNVELGEVRKLPLSNAVSFSGAIDLDWSPLGVIGIGVGMVLGSVGLMGMRLTRAGR